MKVSNQMKFIELRKKYPFFSYEDFNLQITDKELVITYIFNISDKFLFQPKIRIPFHDIFKKELLSEIKMKSIVFQIGMVELISYWKTTCSERVIIKPYLLHKNQIVFWKKLYYNGLGEFFYLNSINTDMTSFMAIECQSTQVLKKEKYELLNSNIIPVGGGKDSVVTMELLNKGFSDNLCLIVNPRKASLDTANNAEYKENEIVKVYRTLDTKLLALNEQGFLNGHTPFSALLAFISVLIAAMAGRRNIALSNESSANEVTVEGSDVNHQYSKSYEFERNFRAYIKEFVADDFNYFSFLRPLSELQIAKLFSVFKHQYADFKSCNVGSKTDVWCCKCPKCLFTFIVLSAFIPINDLIGIFGKNLFEDNELQFYFDQLIGKESIKPFECVGTVDEVNSALCLTLNKYYSNNNVLPCLLQYYKTTSNYQQYKGVNEKVLLKQFDNEHFLQDEFLHILKMNM